MIADLSAEIKIAIFQSVWKRQRDVVKLWANRAKIERFNSINSEITGRKCTKFECDVARLLPSNLFESRFTIGQSIVECRSK